MDNISEGKHLKICYKLSQHLYDSLNIVHSSTNSLTVLWNKYQILVFDDFKFEEVPKVIEPEFNVSNLVICNNYLICLDDSGNVHNVSLKFKHAAQKRFKGSFQPREQNITAIECTGDYTYSLKLVSDTYYICRHKSNVDLLIEAKIALEKLKPLEPKQPIFYLYSITEIEFENIKGFFKIEETWKQHVLFLISLDRLSLWVVLCSNKSNDESMNVFKLYNTPSEISNVNIIKFEDNLNVLISLKIGAVIKIPFITPINADVTHLNIAIHKLLVMGNRLFYSDCKSLWVSEAFKKDTDFKQLFIKNIKDFILIGDCLLCTTYSNLIYSCMIDDDGNYAESATTKYCPADTVLSNSNCLRNIMKEIEKSDEIVSKINEKKKYITTLALSNRKDVMDTLFSYNVTVYENFDDICKEKTISIIDDIREYYDENSIIFLIKIETTTLHNNYNELLSNLYGDLKVHVILETKEKILKKVTLTFNEQMKKINIVVPQTMENETFYKVNVDIKLVTEIPGIFETKQSIWTTLHRKNIILNSENFIKTHRLNNNIHSFNERSKSVGDLINKTAITQYGHLFNFNLPNKNTMRSLYLKLPETFDKLLKNESYFTENNPKALSIVKQITEDFLQSKSELCLNINKEKVKLEIINDGFTKPSLKTSSENLEIAIDIKNVMSKLIYNDFREMEPEIEFVDQALYTTVEYLEKSMKDFMKKDCFGTEEFMNLFHQYQKTVRSFLLT